MARQHHLKKVNAGVIVPDGVGLQVGTVTTLPTASVAWFKRFLADADGVHVCQSDGAGGYEWILIVAHPAPVLGYTVGVYVIFFLRPNTTPESASSQWDNQPAGSTELFGATHDRRQVDLTHETEYYFTTDVNQVGHTTAVLNLEYTTDLTGATGWTSMAGTTLPLSATGWVNGGWDAIPTLAKDVVLLRVVGSGGNATADPRFNLIAVQFRGTGVQGATGATGATGAAGTGGGGSIVDILMLGGM